MRLAELLIATLAWVAAAAVAGAGAAGAAQPPCFGAAALDPARPCSSPTLAVFPTAEAIDADHVAGSRCRPVAGDPAPICAFGAARSRARRHFALLGDSHALHWRRAVDVLATAERWRGYSITTAACPFSAAVDRLPQGLRTLCRAWYRSALAWFDDHPEVGTVFVSAFAPLPVEVRGVASGGGAEVARIKVAGYRRAWGALPRTVEHIVVIRDVPLTNQETFDCVQRVIAEGTRPPGPACTTSRAYAIRWDTAVSAARTLRSPRYQHVDLTELFCRVTCDPVVGGARVYRDPFGHITTAYSRTLGPYLRRAVRRLMRSW